MQVDRAIALVFQGSPAGAAETAKSDVTCQVCNVFFLLQKHLNKCWIDGGIVGLASL